MLTIRKLFIILILTGLEISCFGQKPYINRFFGGFQLKESRYNNNIKDIYCLAKNTINNFSYTLNCNDTITSNGFSFDSMTNFENDNTNNIFIILKHDSSIKKISTLSKDISNYKNIDYYFCHDSDSASVYIAYIFTDSLREKGFFANGFFYYDKGTNINYFFSLNDFQEYPINKKIMIPEYTTTENINCFFVLYANHPVYRYNWFDNEIESISDIIMEENVNYEIVHIYTRCPRKSEFLLNEISLNDLTQYTGVERFKVKLYPDIDPGFPNRPYWLYSFGYK